MSAVRQAKQQTNPAKSRARTGVIAQKVGMSRIYSANGNFVPVTVLKLDACQVVGQKTVERDGYAAVQVGVGARKAKSVSKPLKNQFAKVKIEPKAKVQEFRVAPEALVEVGAEITPEHFVVGQMVDVGGYTIGKGFAGVMKRHNFRGLEASHGVSVSHRSHGSTGQRQDPGRVFKGKKMAGHMGTTKATIQSLEVMALDVAEGLIIVKGAVPGSKGGYVTIRDAVRVKAHKDLPFPAGLKKAAAKETAPVAEAAAPASEQPPVEQPKEASNEG